MNANLKNFLISLEIMGKGMLGIFVVIILITLFVVLLTRLDSKKKQ